MPTVTRAPAAAPLSTDKNEDVCAICCHALGTERVKTYCGHEFHGQCIVNSLQYKPQCPVCRHVPVPPGRAAESEPSMSDALYDSRVIDDVQYMIGNRLERFSKSFLQQMMVLFSIPNAETSPPVFISENCPCKKGKVNLVQEMFCSV